MTKNTGKASSPGYVEQAADGCSAFKNAIADCVLDGPFGPVDENGAPVVSSYASSTSIKQARDVKHWVKVALKKGYSTVPELAKYCGAHQGSVGRVLRGYREDGSVTKTNLGYKWVGK